MNNNKPSKFGHFLASVVWTVFVACASALAISLTLRIMSWLVP